MNGNRAGLFGQSAKTLQRTKRRFNGFLVELAGFREALSEAAKYLFIEKHRRRTDDAFIDDDTDRVRANVDDRDGLESLEAALCYSWTHAVVFLSACARLRCAIRRGPKTSATFRDPTG